MQHLVSINWKMLVQFWWRRVCCNILSLSTDICYCSWSEEGHMWNSMFQHVCNIWNWVNRPLLLYFWSKNLVKIMSDLFMYLWNVCVWFVWQLLYGIMSKSQANKWKKGTRLQKSDKSGLRKILKKKRKFSYTFLSAAMLISWVWWCHIEVTMDTNVGAVLGFPDMCQLLFIGIFTTFRGFRI